MPLTKQQFALLVRNAPPEMTEDQILAKAKEAESAEPSMLATIWQKIAGPSKTTPVAPSPVSSDPTIQQGIDIAKKENPNLAPVSMYGPVSRAIQPNSQGYTSPGGTIYLNSDQLQGMSPQDIADTVVHENTHAQQMQRNGGNPIMEMVREIIGGSTPYGQRPEEMEAFQAEKQRRANQGRTQTAYPSFSNPGQYVVPLDTNLPNDKRK